MHDDLSIVWQFVAARFDRILRDRNRVRNSACIDLLRWLSADVDKKRTLARRDQRSRRPQATAPRRVASDPSRRAAPFALESIARSSPSDTKPEEP